MNPIDPNRPVRPSDQVTPADRKSKSDKSDAEFRLDQLGQAESTQPDKMPIGQDSLRQVRRVLDSLPNGVLDQSEIVQHLVRDQLEQEYGAAVDQKVVQQVTESIMEDPQMSRSVQVIISAARELPETSGGTSVSS